MSGRFLPPFFGLIGLSVAVALYQSQEMMHVVWDSASAIPEKGAPPSAVPVKKTVQAMRSVAQDPQSTGNEHFDLIFWSNEPILVGNGVDRDSLVISRSVPRSHKVEGIRVDFRLCNGTCPTRPQGLSQKQIEAHIQFRRNVDRELQIHTTGSDRDDHKRLIRLDMLEVITFWSDKCQQHIPVEYPQSSLRVTWCDGKVRLCPVPCPQNRPDMEYSYLRDQNDQICKSSHPDDIPPTRLFGSCGCEGTCFTPEAGQHNSTWPWKNASQRDWFLPHWNSYVKTKKVHLQAEQWEAQRRNSPGWRRYEARFACPKNPPEPTPRPIVGAYLHHLYYIPEAKLIFCGIPKVGVTEWVKFFRYALGAKDYLSLPHYKEDRMDFLMKKLEYSKAEELWNDPTWTKAVFFRNPFERLLSAYMDKFVGNSYTQKIFNIGNLTAPKSERPVLAFAQFVDRIADTSPTSDNCQNPNGLSACTDPHWGPQMMMCGLDYWMPKFDFLGSFDHISEHTKILLDRVGLWDKYGATFDDGRHSNQSSHMCVVPPPQRDSNFTVLGFNQRGPTRNGKTDHATGSQSRFDELYTPDLIAKVRQAYALDFAVWDEISAKTATDVAKGSDLKVVRDYCTESHE